MKSFFVGCALWYILGLTGVFVLSMTRPHQRYELDTVLAVSIAGPLTWVAFGYDVINMDFWSICVFNCNETEL